MQELNEKIEAVLNIKCEALYLHDRNLLNAYREQTLRDKQGSREEK